MQSTYWLQRGPQNKGNYVTGQRSPMLYVTYPYARLTEQTLIKFDSASLRGYQHRISISQVSYVCSDLLNSQSRLRQSYTQRACRSRRRRGREKGWLCLIFCKRRHYFTLTRSKWGGRKGGVAVVVQKITQIAERGEGEGERGNGGSHCLARLGFSLLQSVNPAHRRRGSSRLGKDSSFRLMWFTETQLLH